jgi:hypothetical protein
MMKRRALAVLYVSLGLAVFLGDMRTSRALEIICSPTTGALNVAEHHSLRDRLEAGVAGPQELSRIETAVRQAQHDCSLAAHKVNVPTVAFLMRLLAINWEREGDPSRADQLFQEAYSTLGNAENGFLEKLAVLNDWANLKLVSGEPQRAAELARLQTSEARREYEHGESKEALRPSLISALEFQAALFEQIGLTDEAHSAEQEVKRLAAEQKPCQGLCGGPLIFHKLN